MEWCDKGYSRPSGLGVVSDFYVLMPEQNSVCVRTFIILILKSSNMYKLVLRVHPAS